MCHLVLLMPLIGVPLFWILPFGYALTNNIVLWLISALLYKAIISAMKRPTNDGFRSLIGTTARVVARQTPDHSAQYLVWTKGELWSAYTSENLELEELVKIAGVKGIGVVVKRISSNERE